ncbi:MAG: type ISP restriction/modification enzyme [Phycisphaerae bacterium]|jgi:hypothetical protein
MNPVENYLKEMYEIRTTGGGVDETSYYGPLCNLVNEIGKTLKPKIKCVSQLKNTGAGNPDFGLFTSDQFKSKESKPLPGQLPERGVIEAKPLNDDSWVTADSNQVSKYWERYGQVLVTNYRDFVFIGQDENGQPLKIETFRLVDNEDEFWSCACHAKKTASEKGIHLIEYLKRVIQYSAALKSPADLAWFLASYAREARMRIEAVQDLPGLSVLRSGLEDALGLKFTGKDGEHFFRATLIQTLFYGIFSSWVLWSRNNKKSGDTKFNWHEAAWNLRVPMIAGLFEQIATPKKLKPLKIDEVLDWTGIVLNRVDKNEFFRNFEEEHAVQYFYEPFLEAYDPDLRKQLGVWYTPPEIVQYQVQRIDTVLRQELNIADGLADEAVYVLDPCCGTGTYLVEVLRKIRQTLYDKGSDALTAQQLKKAAVKRIFGFEILPAPFVISHLQLGLLLQELGAPFSEKKNERAAVYLTNALTGWEPPEKPKDQLPYPELQEEKDAAEKVKQKTPILVILGNPPYNAFAGTSPEEEGGLVDAYKEGLNKTVKEGGWGIKKFNLDDLYVRFFRIAEKRIIKGRKGIVSFISNFSYLGEPSFVVMRNNFLKNFDNLWFDCMNGDSRETGKLTPDGKPDPSVFSSEYNKAGIRVGTAVCLMVRKEKREKTPSVCFRHFWGANKKQDLLESLNKKDINKQYKKAQPAKENRFSFRPSNVSENYLEWPKLTDFSKLPQEHGPVVLRDFCLGAFEYSAIAKRMKAYLDKKIPNEEILNVYKGLMTPAYNFNPIDIREKFLKERVVFDKNKIINYLFKPYDNRFYYNETRYGLCCRPSPKLVKQLWKDNSFIISRSHSSLSTNDEGHPICFSRTLGDYDLIRGHARFFPIWFRKTQKKSKDDDGMTANFLGEEPQKETIKANLSEKTKDYLKKLNFNDPDKNKVAAEVIWMHCLAIAYSPKYLDENADGIRQDWPRIPLPDSKKVLTESAKLGKQIAALLDTEQDVDGVTAGNVSKELSNISLVSRTEQGNINPDEGELDVTAGWGHAGKNGVCMPGKGKLITRPYTEDETKTISPQQRTLLGEQTCDVYLNDKVYFKNIPLNVWNYYIGGYQIIKKWLSYREKSLLERGLTMEEVLYVRRMARRISSIILLELDLNSNYTSAKDTVFSWK